MEVEMTESGSPLKGWIVGINGTRDKPEEDKLTLTRHDPSRVFLEIDVPGLRSAGEGQRLMGRVAIHEVLISLQEALDSPSALAGFRP